MITRYESAALLVKVSAKRMGANIQQVFTQWSCTQVVAKSDGLRMQSPSFAGMQYIHFPGCLKRKAWQSTKLPTTPLLVSGEPRIPYDPFAQESEFVSLKNHEKILKGINLQVRSVDVVI